MGRKANAKTQEGLLGCIQIHKEWQKTEEAPGDFESIMKGLGMCVWSWPRSLDFSDAFRVCQICTSGQGIQMPYPSLSIDDQPNLFYEFLMIYLRAKSDYMELQSGKN